jgi:Flp pilus assembly protein TadD
VVVWHGHRPRRRKSVLAETTERAHELLRRGEQAEFLSFTETAIERFPHDAELRLMYATALMPFRPNEVAWQAATAVSFDTDDPGYLTRAARLLPFCGEIEAAESYIARANEFAPPDFLFANELADLKVRVAELRGQG